MLHIITLLCLLLSLYQSGVPVTSDPRFLQQVFLEVQTQGVQTATERLQSDLPGFLSEAGIGQTEAPQIDIEKLDYKEELKKLGLYKEETKDAKLNLRNAVLRFQSNCNLKVDGRWNDQCLEVLANQLMTGITVCKDQIEAPPTEGKWIAINKTKRILTLYENKKVLQKYPVAIGNPPSLTPHGKFTIVSKVVNPAWGGGGYAKPVKGGIPQNPLGYRWMGLSYKDGGTLGIHGNNSPYSIGTNASHGCIRMINSDVEQLFTVVPKSAPVWIGTDDILKEWGVGQPEYEKGDSSQLKSINEDGPDHIGQAP